MNFFNDSREGDLNIFVFNGHGCQVNGKNRLIPIHRKQNFNPETDAVCLDDILSQLPEEKNVVNLIIIDACKSVKSCYSGCSPLAPIPTNSAKFCIWYACGDGQVSYVPKSENGNSFFIKAMLKYMPHYEFINGVVKYINLELCQLFRKIRKHVKQQSKHLTPPQQPQMHVGYDENVYLAPQKLNNNNKNENNNIHHNDNDNDNEDNRHVDKKMKRS